MELMPKKNGNCNIMVTRIPDHTSFPTLANPIISSIRIIGIRLYIFALLGFGQAHLSLHYWDLVKHIYFCIVWICSIISSYYWDLVANLHIVGI